MDFDSEEDEGSFVVWFEALERKKEIREEACHIFILYAAMFQFAVLFLLFLYSVLVKL